MVLKIMSSFKMESSEINANDAFKIGKGYNEMLPFPTAINENPKDQTSKLSLTEKLKNWSIQGFEHHNIRDELNRIMSDKSLFHGDVNLGKEEQRVQTLKQLLAIAQGIFDKGLVQITDLREDPSKILAMMDIVSQFDDDSLMTKLIVNNFLFGAAVFNLGTERHHKLLPEIQSGRLLGCFAMTELGHGSNVRSLETTATYDPKTNEFIINTPLRTSTKWWIGNAGHATISSVFARLIIDGKDQEVHCFLVPIRKSNGIDLLPGIRIGDVGAKFGLNGVDNGWIQFENVRIPATNLLDRFGSVEGGVYSSPIKSPSRRFANILAQMITGRITISFGTTRTLKSGLIIATRYASKRLQFGPTSTGPEIPILSYPTHQLTIMPMIASAYAFDAIKVYLGRRFQERTDEAEIHVLASGLKAMISQYTTVSLMELRRLCGGHGYGSYSRYGRLIATVDVGRTFEGDNTLLLQQVAKDLLTQFKKEYSGNKFTGTLKYLGKNTSLLISGMNPLTTMRSDDAHLLSFQFLLDSMEFRSSKLLIQSAQTVSKNYKQTKDSFAAWNQSLEILIHLAKAHTETVIVTKFIESINKEKDIEVRSTLKKLCQLYGLYIIRQDFEFFRNSNYLKKGKAKAIIKLVGQLCSELSQNALVLVKGFGNEEHLMESPLGMEDGDLYENICKQVGGNFTRNNYLNSKL
ncbi:hypothetical protein DICPUDRAFT_97730 [Dictyostelium purpureum]|uniref:Acyl-coenzyme A oxidase n=1 Tax=Dictyostelium purpureum TaxID=5786 RepID=F0ZJB3_DICPU|nr:uncharacterized protein DICPUDRAFT_97730 [Dictyostelium purpureum]EGC35948.1 hypothetical protein DICPUDRAFT_97730 [Dictyostelium purpureum]|eukprot:XP_003287521.1 hypothetical protein DICPUDRAFT_97730 [Dictyostelium purpureum]